MRVLLDVNLLLDEAIPRPEFEENSRRVIEWCAEHADATLIAFHTFTNVYFILRRHRDDAWARGYLSRLLDWVEVAPTGTDQLRECIALESGDAEDQLQCVSARDAGADLIVTRDDSFRDCEVRIVSPIEFIEEFVSESAA